MAQPLTASQTVVARGRARPRRRRARPRSTGAAVALLLLGGCTSGDGAAPPGPTATTTATKTTAGPAEPAVLAKEAFLAGVPLVTTVRTMQTFAQLVGTNTLFWVPRLANPTSRFVVAPNRDTIYALAIVDLRSGPQVLTVPEIRDRYYVFQFMDAWMNNFGYVGTRATNGRAGSWVVVPPGYRDSVPAGMHRLEASTNQVIILGRIRAVDDADAAKAVNLRDSTTLRPLPQTVGAPPPEAPPMPEPAGTPQTVGENGVAYFDELGDALVANPPVSKQQRTIIRSAASLGVGPGRHPGSDPTSAPAEVLGQATEDGLRELEDRSIRGSRTINGWSVNLDVGRADGSLDLREKAAVAKYYWGPNVAEEAVYPVAQSASDGRPLDGSKRYVIHIPAQAAPPVDAFWSYTVYGPDMFFVPNGANRYNISGQTPGLVTNEDGSRDIYVQHDPPAGHEQNWLPVPEGRFNLVMRLYLPRGPVLDDTYRYPPVTLVD